MSQTLASLLEHIELAPSLPDEDSGRIAAEIAAAAGLVVYPRSIVAKANSLWLMARGETGKLVGCVTQPSAPSSLPGDERQVSIGGDYYSLRLATTNRESASHLRTAIPFLRPQALGLQKSAGCGDRLGLATAGHIQGLRATYAGASDDDIAIAPIFAQQSIRENARTGRSPQEVLDDAMWGVFQEGWRRGYGADADHLKSTDDVDSCVRAGYTFYTVDPGDHVDDRATRSTASAVQEMAGALPWDRLEDTQADLIRRLTDKPIELAEFTVQLTPEEVVRAAVKYGRAVAHTVKMYRRLQDSAREFDFEMSVDETETVTTLAEHIYIASELQRVGVKCVSLAPRYVGTFEKGVDYIGDINAFEASFRQHHAVALAYGPYKLSLHSGSDKFSVYPVAAAVAGDLVHLKTAGTSYLEALRAIAAIDPALFRDVVAFARVRYPEDRASYHVSADLDRMPNIHNWPDGELPALLDDFHAREVLHVTFGSVLNRPAFREPFFADLRSHEDVYDGMLSRHFARHFAPFA